MNVKDGHGAMVSRRAQKKAALAARPPRSLEVNDSMFPCPRLELDIFAFADILAAKVAL
jgi:hypothetical protein